MESFCRVYKPNFRRLNRRKVGGPQVDANKQISLPKPLVTEDTEDEQEATERLGFLCVLRLGLCVLCVKRSGPSLAVEPRQRNAGSGVGKQDRCPLLHAFDVDQDRIALPTQRNRPAIGNGDGAGRSQGGMHAERHIMKGDGLVDERS